MTFSGFYRYLTGNFTKYLLYSYLFRLLPREPVTQWNFENRVKLKYHRLKKAFKSNDSPLEPAKTKKAVQIDSRKDPLEKVI